VSAHLTDFGFDPIGAKGDGFLMVTFCDATKPADTQDIPPLLSCTVPPIRIRLSQPDGFSRDFSVVISTFPITWVLSPTFLAARPTLGDRT
jgi:hypothetical protein